MKSLILLLVLPILMAGCAQNNDGFKIGDCLKVRDLILKVEMEGKYSFILIDITGNQYIVSKELMKFQYHIDCFDFFKDTK